MFRYHHIIDLNTTRKSKHSLVLSRNVSKRVHLLRNRSIMLAAVEEITLQTLMGIGSIHPTNK